jgi:hypothetical protein
VVDYDETTPPGGEGKINVKIDTSGYSQVTINKTAIVSTNDPRNSQFSLKIRAAIKVLININPKNVTLNGFEGDIISKSVTIIGNGEMPLELKPRRVSIGEEVTYEIETIEKGKLFKIHFKNTAEAEDTISTVLNLETNYPEKPLISIPITGKLRTKTE